MILCMDMDAFFASVEQAANPHLRGKPIAVIGARERTVVVTCSYEARALGVRTGMSKYEAVKVCPSVQLVCTSNRVYTHVSSEITKYLRTITPNVEVYSIDEAFLDISDCGTDPVGIAYMIKSHVKRTFNITCSVGVGPNKLVAKMASGINKPDGFYMVEPDEAVKFMDSFELGKIWGIGRKLDARFRNMGIFNTADLRQLGEERLCEMFGLNGSRIYEMACGRYPDGVNEQKKEEPVKSIGHSMTIPHDIRSREEAASYILQLSEMVSARARKNGYSGKTLHLTIRDSEMGTVGKRRTFGFFTSATHHIYEIAMSLFDELWDDYPIRLLGISLGSLVPGCVMLSNIMDDFQGWPDIYDAIDKINDKYGKQVISYASVLKCKRRGAKTISPAWRPEGTRNVEF
ncbi:DNA-directed DNA polymerase [Denitrovibrio acetiphilus DSM 12809]|uniref:DNA polymerase IV n=1 Tax=Denitrovibrio acetiphilus (strain DSM 12809 / NBRC 114555 / N2460) TaxID=522772 RepID=D4H7Z8_DENA2|nr:DNA polymerase IV [Denitrovibrio acetiphilus]ADD68147.1 DNA-directed DNA polymerase [Denitrovibrio acetiphilus DSM 12809]